MNSDKAKIHESFEIVGFDKTLLSPVLTDELINTENMTNYTVPENQKAPFTFEAESINPTVSEEGQFKILGTVNQDTEEDIEFTLELIYPAGYMTKCTLHKVLVDQVEVTCVLDEPWLCRNWTSSNKRWIELFIFTEICSDEILHGGEETSTEEEEETEQPIEEPISEEEAEAIMNVSLSFSK